MSSQTFHDHQADMMNNMLKNLDTEAEDYIEALTAFYSLFEEINLEFKLNDNTGFVRFACEEDGVFPVEGSYEIFGSGPEYRVNFEKYSFREFSDMIDSSERVQFTFRLPKLDNEYQAQRKKVSTLMELVYKFHQESCLSLVMQVKKDDETFEELEDLCQSISETRSKMEKVLKKIPSSSSETTSGERSGISPVISPDISISISKSESENEEVN